MRALFQELHELLVLQDGLDFGLEVIQIRDREIFSIHVAYLTASASRKNIC